MNNSMNAPPLEFTWWVYGSGYEWFDPKPPEPSEFDRGRAAHRPLVAMLRPCELSEVPRDTHPLIETPDLFQQFARLELRREPILKFANKFGLLELAITPSVLPAWEHQIKSMNAVIALSRAIREQDRGQLSEWVSIESDGKVRLTDRALEPSVVFITPRDSCETREGTSGAFLLCGRPLSDSREGEVEAATILLKTIIRGGGPRVRIGYEMEESGIGSRLVSSPVTLLDAMWIQFCQSLGRRGRTIECIGCGKKTVVDVDHELSGRQGRSDRRYCNASCKTKKYRLCKKARRLFDEGKSSRDEDELLGEIALAVGRPEDIVREWVRPKPAKT